MNFTEGNLTADENDRVKFLTYYSTFCVLMGLTEYSKIRKQNVNFKICYGLANSVMFVKKGCFLEVHRSL